MSQNFSKLLWISLTVLLCLDLSCVQKRVALPQFRGGDIREALAEKRRVTEMEATFALSFGRSAADAGVDMRTDGALTIAGTGDLDLRLYTFGFLAMELTSQDGEVRSSPKLEANKRLLLTEGLRDCIFWWNLGDFSVEEEAGWYLLRSDSRRVWVDKKSFLPLRQVVTLADGKELSIFYEEPVQEKDRWYQSRVRIEFLDYAASLSVKTLEVRPAEPACVYCAL